MNIFDDSRQCKILLVDDTKTNLDLLIQTLRDDHKLAAALDGKKAIEYAKNNPLDLILLDIMMPEMDGFEVCRRLKEDPTTSTIPIIFITALDASKDKTRGFEIGAVDYITKPFDILEVKARVRTHLNLKLAQEALRNQNVVLEERVLERTKQIADTQNEILERLGLAAELRDCETGQHIKRMSEFCRLMSKAVKFSSEERNNFALASTMHDVGKIGIPDTILLKPGKLTEEEFTVIKKHPAIGARILSGSRSKLLQASETISLTHHEKWDGTGYPGGLRGEEIPLIGRITCICDVFDALISERPYKKAWPVEKAIEEIRLGSGTHFDPALVDLLVSMKAELMKIIQALGLY
jgi:putative two-component system response regulator